MKDMVRYVDDGGRKWSIEAELEIEFWQPSKALNCDEAYNSVAVAVYDMGCNDKKLFVDYFLPNGLCQKSV